MNSNNEVTRVLDTYCTKVTLDGASSGIGAFIRSRNSWIKRSDGKTNLFTNFRTLEGRLFREEHLDYHDVSICFIVQDAITGKATVSINEAIRTEDGWKISRYETLYGHQFLHIYDITEIEHDQVVNIGYISTKEAGTHDPNKDPKYEYAKLKKLRTITTEAAKNLATYQIYGVSVGKSKQGLMVTIDNTSAVVHIWANGKLMDYNSAVKKRRETNEFDGTRCLPYTKDMDKYGTLYMFATCDESDHQDEYTRTAIDRFEESFIMVLQDMYPDLDVKYIPCQYQGKVLLNLSEEEG